MKGKLLLFLGVVLSFLMVTSAYASNMGFKITVFLDSSGSTDQNWFSLPFNVSYTNAADIKTDIGANCFRVYRWLPASDAYEYYESARSGVNFSLTPGEGYMAVVTADTNWVVVGSHAPGTTIAIDSSGATDQTWISLPYHTTAANAADLKTEMTGEGLGIFRVYHWLPATDSYEYYESARSGVNFSITPGEGLLIVSTTSGTFDPDHY
jgi:hypothetical protein